MKQDEHNGGLEHGTARRVTGRLTALGDSADDGLLAPGRLSGSATGGSNDEGAMAATGPKVMGGRGGLAKAMARPASTRLERGRRPVQWR